MTDSDGDVWAISNSPPPFGLLLHFVGDALKEEISHDRLPLAKATHLAADPNGGIWLPLEGGRVAHWSHDRAEIIGVRGTLTVLLPAGASRAMKRATAEIQMVGDDTGQCSLREGHRSLAEPSE